MPEYWLARNGQQYGPYPMADLQRMMAEGRAGAADTVWTEGMAAWEPLSKVLSRGATQPLRPPPPPPTPAYQPPAAYGAPAAAPGAVPPSLHWALVLLFGYFTLGIFSWIWCLKEANFVRKLNPGNSSLLLMVIGIIGQVAALLSVIGILASSNDNDRAVFSLIYFVLIVVAAIFFLVAVFKMRRTLLNHYNLVEPIGLRLSGAMTFFFNILYLQHHFSRIAKWKQTGFLEPQ
jgi:hypothetical protein